MGTKIFVNLPVKDLDKSKAFFAAIGYTFNPQFTDETAACMVISEDIYAMLLTEKKFGEFMPQAKTIADARKTTEVMVALSADSRARVDELCDKAMNAGAGEVRPAQDYGFMYGRSFADIDGHIWEAIWMDPNFVQKA